MKYSYEYILIELSDEASKFDGRKGEHRILEVMDEMAISQKEMKLLMNFVKDDLKIRKRERNLPPLFSFGNLPRQDTKNPHFSRVPEVRPLRKS